MSCVSKEVKTTEAAKNVGAATAGYAAIEMVSMPTFMTGNDVSITDPDGAAIALVGMLVAYNLYRIFNP